MPESTSYAMYTSEYDKSCVHQLLSKVLSDYNFVSVFDGEEWTLHKSADLAVIKEHLATTGEDWLKIEREDGTVLGQFYLIYNNGSSPMETITDHSDTDYCNLVWDYLDSKLN